MKVREEKFERDCRSAAEPSRAPFPAPGGPPAALVSGGTPKSRVSTVLQSLSLTVIVDAHSSALQRSKYHQEICFKDSHDSMRITTNDW